MGVFNNFPYANFHELNADWIIEQVRKVMDEWEEYKTDMDLWKLGVDDQLAEFQAWFDNLDVQDEVRTVMNELILSGEFIEITSPQIVSATEAWLAAHITPTTPAVDDTLSISGAAADAKVTGDRIADLKEDINTIAEINLVYKKDEQTVTGTSAWNGAYLNTGIEPVYGETYYLHIDSVVDCKSNVCAKIIFRNGNTDVSYVNMTVSDVENGVAVSKTVDTHTIDTIIVALFRNNSSSTVEAGTTTFTGVRLTTDSGTVRATATQNLILTENNDYNALVGADAEIASNLEDFKDYMTSEYNLEYFNNNQIDISGTASYNGVTLTTDITPIFGDTYYLHIDSVENCVSPSGNCARLNLKANGTVYSYAYLSVTDVESDIALPKVCDSRTVDEIEIVLYRNSSSSTVEAGTTTFKGVRITRNSSEIEKVVKNYWTGKKIAWFGTSIPAGSYDSDNAHRYPNIIGSILGATVYNEAVGSSSISRTIPTNITTDNPYGFDNTDFEFSARCLTNTIEMQNWLIANYNSGYFVNNVPTSMPTSLQNTIRNYSYENKVDRYLDGGSVGNVDLYVFDHGYNEYYHNRDVEALETEYGLDTKYCYDGGMNFLIRRILKANPDAKIVQISHYTDNATDSQHNTTAFVEAVRDAQLDVCKRWGIKFINIFEKLGWSGQIITTQGYWNTDTNEWVNSGGASQSIQIKDIHVRDTIHPYTDASGKSNHRIAEVISAEIENIIR